ncbi:MAG TPA: hypothetical protein VIH18_33590, partial [Candidatus Binatia bacterium]
MLFAFLGRILFCEEVKNSETSRHAGVNGRKCFHYRRVRPKNLKALVRRDHTVGEPDERGSTRFPRLRER